MLGKIFKGPRRSDTTHEYLLFRLKCNNCNSYS